MANILVFQPSMLAVIYVFLVDINFNLAYTNLARKVLTRNEEVKCDMPVNLVDEYLLHTNYVTSEIRSQGLLLQNCPSVYVLLKHEYH